MEGGALTARQRQALDRIVEAVRERGYFPSVREIGAALGVRSPATAAKHLRALEARGALVREGGRLLLAPRLRRAGGGIPMVGRVAAGAPIEAPENREGELSLAGLFGDAGGLFAVRVRGDSMEGAGILEGDLVVVRPGARPRDGDTVVAYVGPEQEATVKVFRRARGGQVVLEPRNPRHAPIAVEGDPHFRIAGKVVGVVRAV
ncbi:MAG: transcriptional repressor LexA [Planctomycetes bacterium]|nr:transcriptional repressor LexA [Planctomycetota bacterium]